MFFSWLQANSTDVEKSKTRSTVTSHMWPYWPVCRNLTIMQEQQLQRQTDVNTCFHTARVQLRKKLICIPVFPPCSADRSPMWHVCDALDRCVRRRVPIPANIMPPHRVAYKEGNIGPQLVTNSLIQSQFIVTRLDLVCLIIIWLHRCIISYIKDLKEHLKW